MSDLARLAAFDVLAAVREQDAYANLALARVLREHGLSGRDAAFVTELVSGTLRRRGSYDAVLAGLVNRPLDRLQPAVLDVLRLGCHQLLAMRVAPHAAVATSVDLARSRVGRSPTGLVNAVLRKVAAHDMDAWMRRVAPDPGADPVGYAALVHSHPRWVVEALAEALGERRDELDALLAADNDPPAVTLAALPGLADPAELPGTPTGRSPYAVLLDRGDPGAVAAVAEGRARVQDEGSQLVASVAAAVPVVGRDQRWLDLCAGPGGKSALLTALAAARRPAARLLAADRAPHRARLVAAATRATGSGALGVIAADGTRPAWRPGSFDRVLVDAPCSGLGALRRRPEARWRRTPQDLTTLVPLQQDLLASAVDAARPGGAVVYATCSPVLAETAEVVTRLLAARHDVRLEDGLRLLPGVEDAAGPLAGSVQLWPHRHGTDAMFIAVLRRDG
ncbi:MAG TPA: transcription antitermination factor NusB [Nocardioidaceae bacterium]|nr:transcription antitermination factor NusB [Nocardioidaceae bacterium]